MTRLTGLPGEVTSLVAAIVETLDIPLPSVGDVDERKHYRVLEHRVSDVVIALSSLLKYPSVGALEDITAYIREWATRYPVTYTPFHSSRTEEAE